MREVDYVVVGAGVMGSSTARRLAGRGKRVVILERFRVGHVRGSSHGRARIFRLSYPETSYVEMAQEALPLWRQLERDAGVDLLRRTGGLDLGEAALDNAKALDACGAEFELMDGAEAKRRFSFLSMPDDETVLYHSEAGITNADRTVEANIALARAGGAELIEGVSARALEATGDRVEVTTENETYRADVAVVAAGAWGKPLLSTAGIDIDVRPTRQTICYFRTDDDLGTVVEWADHVVYGLPSPGQGLKAGEHDPRQTIDPDVVGEPDPESAERIAAWVRERFPNAEPEAHHVETCIYTNTPDEHFILERHGPIVVGSPCSGHGFKFSPLIGKRLADLATA